MPEYSYQDRLAIMAEQSMWTVVGILKEEARSDHGFTEDFKAVLESAEAVARKLTDYNDQFETMECDI